MRLQRCFFRVKRAKKGSLNHCLLLEQDVPSMGKMNKSSAEVSEYLCDDTAVLHKGTVMPYKRLNGLFFPQPTLVYYLHQQQVLVGYLCKPALYRLARWRPPVPQTYCFGLWSAGGNAGANGAILS